MTYSRLVFVAFLMSIFVPESAAISPELAPLEALANDQKALVDATRRFDLQQQSLIDWDRSMASEYSNSGLPDLVATKGQDIRRRLALIREAWEFVLGYYPNNARANNYYGELFYDYLGDQWKGLEYWKLAVKFDEDLGLAHNNLGLHYFHQGQYDKGLRHLGTALGLEPKNPDFLFNVAQIYLNYFPQLEKKYDMNRKKVYKEAIRMSRDAAKYAPDEFDLLQDYAVNFYAAENFGVEADWEEAAEAWEKARAYAPNAQSRFFTFLNEGRVWLRAKKPERAAVALEEAKRLRPDSEVTSQLLDQANREAGTPS